MTVNTTDGHTGKRSGRHTGFLSRLLRDRTANVLPLTAAAVIPMIALTGSAIDVSRLYIAKSRLQSACDAGVLAGRKAMTTTTYSTAAQTRANAMFNFNYRQADYRATGTTFTATADSTGKLDGVAHTTVPMIVMGIMGFTDSDIDVNCSADIQVPNIDVVFVLDVTGSMDEYVGSTKKIDALKSAVASFYDTIATAMAGNTRTRVRYGFVPYSVAVNATELFVGSPNFDTLGQLNRSHLITNMTVQSRVANFNTPVNGAWTLQSSSSFNQRFNSSNADSKAPDVAANPTGTVMSNLDCDDYSANLSFSIDNSTNLQVWFPLRTSWPGDRGIGNSVLYKAQGSSTWQATEPTTGTSYTKATFSRQSNTWTDDNGLQTGNYKTCTRRVTHEVYTRRVGFGFTDWTYQPVVMNVTNYAAGTGISYVSSINTSTATVGTAGTYTLTQLAALADQTGLTRSTASWNGCVEERDTTAAATFSPVPAQAFDLDYRTGGTNETMRWRPAMPDMTYIRTGTANETTTASRTRATQNCPGTSMRNLREYSSRTDFVNYVNSLSPSGNTYLDVGMVWGLRLIDPQGMFAARNLTGPNGGQISRHVIFLTDGEPVSSATTYSAYGVEQNERRITGSTGVAAATLHARRFQALCDAERGRIGIWAIALGVSVTGNMQSCADSGRAMQANSTTELRNAFNRIANEVADLRLVQ